MNKNPLIEQYNYWKPYQDAAEKLKQGNPDALKFTKLCFDTFETKAGKELMQMIEQKYLIPSLAKIGCDDYPTHCVYSAGFKEAFLTIRNAIEQHRNYIESHKDKS